MTRWFRFYDEALDDPKVQRLAPHLFKTWINILCVASRTEGRIPNDDDVAFKLRMSVKDASEQIQDLILAGLIDVTQDGERVAHNWDVRQRPSDKSVNRTRKYRENLKKKTSDGICDDACDVTVTVQNREEEKRKEVVQSRASAPDAATPLPDRMTDRMIEAAGPCLANHVNAQGLLTEATPVMWLENGCDFERDVLPTLRAAGVSRKGKRIHTWSYFTNMVAEARARRLAGMPAIQIQKPKSTSYTPTPRRDREPTREELDRIAMEFMN